MLKICCEIAVGHCAARVTQQDIKSLPKPYRLWQWGRWKWNNRGAAGKQLETANKGSRLNPYKNWSKMAARNVRELLEIKRRWTSRCGRICVRMHRIQEWISASFSKSAVPPHGPTAANSRPQASTAAPAPLFHAQIDTNRRFFSRLYFYTTGEEISLPAQEDSSIEGKILGLQALLSQYDHFLVHLENSFDKSFEAEIQRRRKPHHLFEYWHLYATGVVVVGAAAVAALRNQSKVKTLVQEAWKAVREFAYEHAQEPLANIWKNITNTFDRSLFSTNAQALRESKKDLSRMLEKFA
jgi:ribosomal protein S20